MTDSMRDRIDRAIYDVWNLEGGDEVPYLSPKAREVVIDALLAAFPWLADEPTVTGATSDGYHSFDELYEYRMLYNAHAAHGWLAAGVPVVKSWRHSDGEACFGGGWFIVTADLPTGQVSNHYPEADWTLFDVPEVPTAPSWDGHSSADGALRLRNALPGKGQVDERG